MPDDLDELLATVPTPRQVRRGIRSVPAIKPQPQAPARHPYASFIEKYSTENGIDPELTYRIAGRENRSANPNATSWAGAQGLMQLGEGTAQRFGVTNPRDPEQNIRGGVQYLRYLLDFFHGDVPSAVAGYNAGEGAVQKYGLRRVRRFSNFPKGDARRGGYAGSTGEYVDKITNGYTGTGYGGTSLNAPPEQDTRPQRDALDALLDDVPNTPAYKQTHAPPENPDALDDLLKDVPDYDPFKGRSPKDIYPQFAFPSTSVTVGDDQAVDLTDMKGHPLSVRPIDAPEVMDKSLGEQIAGGASYFGSTKEKEPGSSSNKLDRAGNFTVKLRGDSRRYPTDDELLDAMLAAYGTDMQQANAGYKAETGRSIGEISPESMAVIRQSLVFDPESHTYEFVAADSPIVRRVAGAYLTGGLQGAKDEAARIRNEDAAERERIAEAEKMPRTVGDTIRAGLSDAGLAEAQLVQNASIAARAATYQGDRNADPEYARLQQEEKRGQQTIDNARRSIPEETTAPRKVIRGVTAGLSEAPMYVASGGAAPVTALVGNLNRGLVPATGAGLEIAATLGVGKLAGGLTNGLNPVVRQIVSRTAMGSTLAGQNLLGGERDPSKILSSFVVGAAFPVGEAGREGEARARPGENSRAESLNTEAASLRAETEGESLHPSNFQPRNESGQFVEGESRVAYEAQGKVYRGTPEELTESDRQILVEARHNPDDFVAVKADDGGRDLVRKDELVSVKSAPTEARVTFPELDGNDKPTGRHVTGERVEMTEAMRQQLSDAGVDPQTYAVVRNADDSLTAIPAEQVKAAANWDRDAGVVRFGKRDIIRVKMPDGSIQGFYRSSGINSGKPGEWLPFDGYVKEINWFNKDRFTSGEMADESHPLHRFGTEENKAISEALGRENIPEGRMIPRDQAEQVNEFIGVNKQTAPLIPPATESAPEFYDWGEPQSVTRTPDARPVDRSSGDAQLEALLNGETSYAFYKRGESLPVLPKGFTKTRVRDGYVIHPESIPSDTIKGFARNGLLDVLDMTDADGNPVMPQMRPPADGLDALLEDVPDAPSRRPSALRIAADAVNVFKSARSSGDVSALLRQGLMFLSEPTAWYRGMKRGIASLNSENYADVVSEIQSSPVLEWAKKSGLYLATQGMGREEAFPSQRVARLPVIKQSEQSFNATLDVMRLETFKKYARIFALDDMTPESDPKAFQDLARRINSMSGRGDLGVLNPYAEALNVPIFSPRLIKARFDVLNPLEYFRMDPRVRKIALAQTAKVLGAVTASLMLAKASGLEVGTDLDKSSFLKIKVGDMYYDITGGYARYLRDAFRLARYIIRLPKDGVNVREDGAAALTEGRKNLSPLPSYIVDALMGKDVTGKDFEFKKNTAQLITPLFVQDVMEAFNDEGLTGAVKALPSAAGVGVETHEKVYHYASDDTRVVNEKAKAKVEGDAELSAIVKELKRVDESVGRAVRHKGESKESWERRLARQEPVIKKTLAELFTSDAYRRMTLVEQREEIRRAVREVRSVDDELR